MTVATVDKEESRGRRERGEDAAPEFAELTLGEMTALGDAAAEFEGETISVAGGIPGERVIARIHRYRRRRKRIVAAIVERVLEPSPLRAVPKCGYYGACSGCQWQHIVYPAQLEFKRQAIIRSLSGYDSLSETRVLPTMPAENRHYYRNHARFTVRRGGQLGFSNRITRRFVRIEHCMIMDAKINESLTQLQDRAGETTNLSIRVGANTGDVLIQPTFQNPDISIPTGQKRYVERMRGRDLLVASPSFFQVNTAQAENLLDIAARGLDLSEDDVLVDAYAGVGVFAILLAPFVRKSVAIEESASAVADARLNAEGLGNVEFIQMKTEEALADLPALANLAAPPDALILDPPRAGCHPDALAALIALAPPRIAYISCDPPSLARDLDILAKGGYAIGEIQPVDMFPQTYHVESVAVLTRADGEGSGA